MLLSELENLFQNKFDKILSKQSTDSFYHIPESIEINRFKKKYGPNSKTYSYTAAIF